MMDNFSTTKRRLDLIATPEEEFVGMFESAADV